MLALIAALPVLLPAQPMMPDLFSHIGRYHVMNHGAESPFLQRYYSFRWQLIGNLGVDLLMVPLGALLPTELAARLAVASIPALTVAGIYAVSRAVWGRVQAPALVALPLALPHTFVFGFVNFHLGLVLVLLAFAWWVRAGTWRWRWAAALPLAGVVWVAHLAAWAVLLVLVAAWELARQRPQRGLAGLVASGLAVLPLAWPFLLTLSWRGTIADHHNIAGRHMTKPLLAKALWFTTLLRGEAQPFDMALAALVVIAAVLLLVRRGTGRSFGMVLAALLLFVAFLILPWQVMGSAYADTRLLPALFIALLAGLAVRERRLAGVVAAAGLMLFLVRDAELTNGWWRRGADAEADLGVLAAVPRGARIAVIARPSGNTTWTLTGLDHLASLAIVRREAFVNTQWDQPGAQLMRPIYNRDHGYNDSFSVALVQRPNQPGRRLGAILAGLPHDRFDFVWSFDAPLAKPWLREVARGPHGRLYRITG
ncbi:hypothetical protein IP88_12030 [alpha proteobacterium AAP81b]|nr:hypothetical protein IP88_12030 [alpha proteobacterium AAP81b]